MARPHPSDKQWMSWDNWVRDIQRALTCVHLTMLGDRTMLHMDLPTVEQQLEVAFALAAGLSKNIENHRLKAIHRGLVPPAPDAEFIVSKEDARHLENQQKIERTVRGPFPSKGKSKGKGKGYHSYHPYAGHGRGKGKGKGNYNKDKPKFQFKHDDQGA